MVVKNVLGAAKTLKIFLIFCLLFLSVVCDDAPVTTSASSEEAAGTCDKDGCDSASALVETVSKPKPKCRVFDPKQFGPKNRTILYGEARGRIGNQLLGYAVLFQLGRHLDVDSYINTDCRDVISETFVPENVELPVLSEAFCNAADIPFEAFNGRLADLMTDPKYRKGKILNFYPPDKNDYLKGTYKPEQHVGPEQETLQQGYVSYIRENFKFKQRIRDRVRKTLRSVAKRMGLKPKEVTYVGIHNRRTDHFELVKKLSGQEPLDKSYFYDAMDYFREEYENVAFLYVSDDMAWGKKNIKNKKKDLFFVGAGENLDEAGVEKVDPDAAAFDLALLVSCNHTIITRGTYSMWAAMLNGGEYYTEYGSIVPVHLQG